jgi:hypothetical protein
MPVIPGTDTDRLLAARPRWRGQAGRTEVWYLTLTDPASGMGIWIHAEFVAPTDRSRPPFTHGWLALFPAHGAPRIERFGPSPAQPADGAQWFASDSCTVAWGETAGQAGELAWDLTWTDDSPPLWTFPKAAWRRELLPGAQVVPSPTASFRGSITGPGVQLRLDGAPGNLAHIYGHGNAERWAWLHAPLGGADVLEVVTAVSRRPGLNRLKPLAFVRLRTGGVDWPNSPITALRSTTALALPTWTVRAADRARRLTVEVDVPADASVAVGYEDPDGATATCTNSERANARITLERRGTSGWEHDRLWTLDGTAHAEVGLRP